jgi:hypothetical protein
MLVLSADVKERGGGAIAVDKFPESKLLETGADPVELLWFVRSPLTHALTR